MQGQEWIYGVDEAPKDVGEFKISTSMEHVFIFYFFDMLYSEAFVIFKKRNTPMHLNLSFGNIIRVIGEKSYQRKTCGLYALNLLDK